MKFQFFSDSGRVVEHDQVVLDPEVGAELGRVVKIVQVAVDGTTHTIYDAAAPPKQVGPPTSNIHEELRRQGTPLVVNGAPKHGTALGFSEDHGKVKVMDLAARTRIEGQHAALRAAGVQVDTSKQVASSGTRMMEMGYDKQKARAREHEEKLPIRDAIDAIVATVESEKRRDIVVSAADVARNLDCNGKIKIYGHVITQTAIRGMAARCESPMLGYVLGLYERIIRDVAEAGLIEQRNVPEERDRAIDLRAGVRADKGKIAQVLEHELRRAGDTRLTLRLRDSGPEDCYAVLGPAYARADAPDLLPKVRGSLPDDARGTWAYDPSTTTWELRAAVWTPTPVEEQAIGEPFEGWASFRSRDNGTSRMRGGGGVTLLACYNAGVYEATGTVTSRVHRGRVLDDVAALAQGATSAINALCAAWGKARTAVVQAPTGVKIEDAIPGFWRYLLTDRRELAGVLPGRTTERVEQLSAAYFSERRNDRQIVRADFAQGWTRAIQTEPADVRRDAETAIGSWLVDACRPMRCELSK